MIYTITLNPALDRTIWVDRIKDDISNRIVKEDTFAAGKSIDVSKVLKNLGIESIALGFVGGFAGRELEGRLLNDGIEGRFVPVSGETRTNIIVHEIETGRQIAFNAKGPEVRPDELMHLMEIVEELDDPEVVAVGGSLPPGIRPLIYRKLISSAKKCIHGSCRAKVFLDVDGESLRLGIQAQPDLIKPNIHELSQLVGHELQGEEQVLQAAREINRGGVETVLVSMGPRGIMLVSQDEEHIAVPPAVEVKNTIGAGDSSVAGFIYGMVNGEEPGRCLIYAAAAGTATTLKQGTALATKDDFMKLVPQIRLRTIKSARSRG
jgi:6-phosphofructokinase 2